MLICRFFDIFAYGDVAYAVRCHYAMLFDAVSMLLLMLIRFAGAPRHAYATLLLFAVDFHAADAYG